MRGRMFTVLYWASQNSLVKIASFGVGLDFLLIVSVEKLVNSLILQLDLFQLELQLSFVKHVLLGARVWASQTHRCCDLHFPLFSCLTAWFGRCAPSPSTPPTPQAYIFGVCCCVPPSETDSAGLIHSLNVSFSIFRFQRMLCLHLIIPIIAVAR